MFCSMGKSIKKDISAARADMSLLLGRLEETEQRQDFHVVAIKELPDTVTLLAFAHRASLLENCNRRNNLRIRGLPEATRDNDQEPSIRGILNTILGNPVTAAVRFD